MLEYKILFFIFTVILILSACQPSLIKKTDKKENIDSVLFYQKKDIPDPFLDGLLTPSGEETVNLKQKIFPKIKPEKFKEIDGFRIQVFASGDSLNALNVLNRLKQIVKDSTYLIYEKNLFKVQAGDFPYRQQADSLRDFVKQNGFTGAWTVQRKILIPVGNAALSQKPTTAQNKNIKAPSALTDYYQIQVFATSDKQKAQTIVDQLSLRYEYPCQYVQQNNLFKVLLGHFATRNQAETVLNEIKNLGFKDAWIVHKP